MDRTNDFGLAYGPYGGVGLYYRQPRRPRGVVTPFRLRRLIQAIIATLNPWAPEPR